MDLYINVPDKSLPDPEASQVRQALYDSGICRTATPVFLLFPHACALNLSPVMSCERKWAVQSDYPTRVIDVKKEN